MEDRKRAEDATWTREYRPAHRGQVGPIDRQGTTLTLSPCRIGQTSRSIAVSSKMVASHARPRYGRKV